MPLTEHIRRVVTTLDASGDEVDERLEMLKLEQLVDKQKEMFSAISNTLKSMNDAQMTAIGNIR